jgi:hypothetical protein
MVGGAAIGFFAGEFVAAIAARFLLNNPALISSLPTWVLRTLGLFSGEKVVLGQNPTYLQRAIELGARALVVPDSEWYGLSEARRWAINRAFLDEAIAKGREIILSNNAYDAIRGSVFELELKYLVEQGYRIVDGGWRIIK